MLTHLPLDDELNRLFYLEGGIWRLVWASALGCCVLRREEANIEFADAVMKIESGALLWAPSEPFERLDADTAFEVVQREHMLLFAFLRSPTGRRMTKWSARRRLEIRVRETQAWLTNRALTRGNADPAHEG
jgi:hypothetical protein